MQKKTIHGAVCCLAALAFAGTAAAQNTSRFNFNIGGGFSEPVYHTDGRVDPGWNLNAGAGVNLVPHLGLVAEFGYNHFGLSDNTLMAAGVPGGNMHVYSVTLNPIIRFNPHGRFDAYLIGGPGYYHRTVDFTAPSISEVTVFDPFYGFFYNTPVATTALLNSFSQDKIGWNVGGGVSVRVKGDSNAKFYAEARYHYIYTTPVRTNMLPVTFGFRW